MTCKPMSLRRISRLVVAEYDWSPSASDSTNAESVAPAAV